VSKLLEKIDARLAWCVRHFFYKILAGRLTGIGYLGRPSFVKGIGRFYSGSGLGIFPGWRIEILNGRVDVGRNVRIGNNFVLNCGSEVIIDDDVTISANVFIGTTDVQISLNLHQSFSDWPVIERPIHIGRGCFIGFGAVLLPGVRLGEGCVVGANSVVRGEFAPGSIIAGKKAQVLRSRV
jgi:acetyltransferase-like isoleucine patch superfamily enzyme